MNQISDIYFNIRKDEKFKRQVLKFLIAGFSAVGTDMMTYYLYLNYVSHSPAKAFSFLTGTIVAYVINKFWTFEQHRKSYSEVLKFIALYMSTLGANVAVNKIALLLFPNCVFFAFLCATGTSTVLNFVGQKWWVFK